MFEKIKPSQFTNITWTCQITRCETIIAFIPYLWVYTVYTLYGPIIDILTLVESFFSLIILSIASAGVLAVPLFALRARCTRRYFRLGRLFSSSSFSLFFRSFSSKNSSRSDSAQLKERDIYGETKLFKVQTNDAKSFLLIWRLYNILNRHQHTVSFLFRFPLELISDIQSQRHPHRKIPELKKITT